MRIGGLLNAKESPLTKKISEFIFILSQRAGDFKLLKINN